MSTMMFSTFGGDPIQPASSSYIEINLSENQTLAWPIQFQNTNLIVFNYLNVIPTANGFNLTLPDATQVSVGVSTIINNPSAFTFTLLKNDGTLLYTFTPGITRYIILIDDTTQGGTWNNHPFTAGSSDVTFVDAVSSSNNLVITGVPITSAGTIDFALANDLLALSTFAGGTGIAARTAANTWNLRTIIGTNNQIGIVNGDGVAGNPTISLATNISGLTSLQVGNINLSGNTITTTNPSPGSNLILNANGTGLIQVSGDGLRIDSAAPLFFYGSNGTNYLSFAAGNTVVNYNLIWPTIAPAINQVLQYVGADELGWVNVTTFGGPSTQNALARFSNTQGSLTNSTVLLDSLGNLTGITSSAIGNLLIGGVGLTPPNTITTTNLDGNIILSPSGSGVVQSTSTIEILNGNDIEFFEDGGVGNYLSFYAPSPLPQIVNFQLPSTIPFISQVMTSATNTNINTILQWNSLPPTQNILINGGFSVWQRGTSFTNATTFLNNDGQYFADQWKLMSDGNNIVNVNRVAGLSYDPTSGSVYAAQFTVATIGHKFGFCQIKQYNDTYNSISLNLGIAGAGNGITSFKMAAIAWTGAINNPTYPIVSAWNATGVNPTLSANWNYISPPQSVTVTNVFSEYHFLSPINILDGTYNIGVMFWCDTTATNIGNTLNFTTASLTNGPLSTPPVSLNFDVELARCKPWYQKDVAYSVAPFTTNAPSQRGTAFVSPATLATIPNMTNYATLLYDTELSSAKAPTLIIYPIVTVTNTNIVSDNTGPAYHDLAANSGTVSSSDTKGFTLQNTSGGNITTTGYFQLHYTVSTEF